MAQVVCTGLWKIWQARNNLVFKSEMPNPQVMAHSIVDSVKEWSDIRKTRQCRASDLANVMVPNCSWFIQSDAGCFESGIVSLGCVIKSTDDKILAASYQRISRYTDAATAELMGIMWAMQLALEHKLDNIVFQSDALIVVDCINGVSFSATLDLLVNDCRQLLNCF
ncbi:uncharacterized protein LOC131629608 [Vicia villosa]|uniref:uncharacterized protein LOC131629608 n=1 Tax=Vicia villosa TaxID=3911 RepID=UPI00273B25D5|nr:uncharacterized protein LOC131629608 [Vicia villosa]